MRQLTKVATRALAPALVLLALAVHSGSSPAALQASDCVRNHDSLCRTNESCARFNMGIWEFDQCTTTYEYGTLVECKYCHN